MRNQFSHVFPGSSSVDLCIHQFGFEACVPSHSFGPAIRQHYLFHYIMEGKGKFTGYNGQTFSLTQGQGFLIHPNLETIYTADASEPWHYAWIELYGIKAGQYWQEMGLTKENPVYTPNQSLENPPEKEAFYKLLNQPQESALYSTGWTYLLLDQLIRRSDRAKTHKITNMKEHYVQEAIRYVERFFTQSFTVEDIAAHCSIDRSYLGKVFKARMGVSPQEFILRYRMSIAAQHLENTSLSVSTIGNSVGYTNAMHFSRAFKNVYGISPKEWRSTNSKH